MKKGLLGIVAALASVAIVPAAHAADAQLIVGDGTGEAPAAIEIQSWSWGASNSGSMASAAQGREAAAPRDAASGMPTGKRMHKPMPIFKADLAQAASQSEVEGFTLALDGASPLSERMCASGKHIAHATLRTAQGDYALDNVTVTDCTRQTQGSNFGEKVASGLSTASISITLTGELRQGKTGHVTLMK